MIRGYLQRQTIFILVLLLLVLVLVLVFLLAFLFLFLCSICCHRWLVINRPFNFVFCSDVSPRPWSWQKIQGQYLGRLHNSLLTFINWSTVIEVWSELYFKIHVPYLPYIYSGQPWPCKSTWKNSISLLFIVILCIMGWPWPWWPWDCGKKR